MTIMSQFFLVNKKKTCSATSVVWFLNWFFFVRQKNMQQKQYSLIPEQMTQKSQFLLVNQTHRAYS